MKHIEIGTIATKDEAQALRLKKFTEYLEKRVVRLNKQSRESASKLFKIMEQAAVKAKLTREDSELVVESIRNLRSIGE